MPSSLTAQSDHHRHLQCGVSMCSDLCWALGEKRWMRPSLLPSRISSLTKFCFPFKHLSSYQKVKEKNLKNEIWNIAWKCWDQHCLKKKKSDLDQVVFEKDHYGRLNRPPLPCSHPSPWNLWICYLIWQEGPEMRLSCIIWVGPMQSWESL